MRPKLLFIAYLITVGYSLSAQQLAWDWTRAIGGTGDEWRPVVATAPNGDVVLGFNSNSPSVNVLGTSLALSGGADIVIARISSGGTLLWTRKLSSSGVNQLYDLGISSGGDIVITGSIDGQLDFGNGNTLSGSTDAFLARLSAGGQHIWSKKMGSSGTDKGFSVTLDSLDNVYVLGDFTGPVFNSDALSVNYSGNPTCFIGRYSPNGTINWLQRVIGNNFSLSNIVAEPNGTLNIGGTLFSFNNGNVSFNNGVTGLSANTFVSQIFLAKLNSSGAQLLLANFPANNGRLGGRRLGMAGNNAFFAGTRGHLASPGGLSPGAMLTDFNSNGFTEILTWDGSSGFVDLVTSSTGGCMGYGEFGGSRVEIPPYTFFNVNGEVFLYGAGALTTSKIGSARAQPGRIAANASRSRYYASGTITSSNPASGVAFGADTLRSAGGADIFIGGTKYVIQPLVVSAGADLQVCPGSSTQLVSSVSGGRAPYTYNWTTPGGPSLGTAPSLDIRPAAPTTYILTVTDIDSLQQQDTILVSMIPQLPAPTITSSGPTDFCLGDSVTLTSSPGPGYFWSNGETTQSIRVMNAGNYSVRMLLQFCPGLPSAITTVRTAAPASKTITVLGATTICQGDSVQLLPGTAQAYLWNNGATTGPIWAKQAGQYYVQMTSQIPGTNINVCNVRSETVTIGASSRPDTSVTITGATSFCQGDSVVLTANADNFSYFWYNGANFIANTRSLKVKSSGAYRVLINNGTGCTLPSAVINVSVFPLPAQPAISASGPLSICQGDTVILSSSPASQYLWSNGATTPSIRVSAAGSFSVKVKNAAGCESVVSAPVSVVVNPRPANPIINISGPARFCQGDSVTLGTSPATQYLWSNGATTPSIKVFNAGIYSVKVKNAFGCESAAQVPVTITVDPLPATPTIAAGGPTTFCPGDSVILSSSSAPQYLWSNGATTSSIKVSGAGIFTVKVKNGFGCESAASLPVSTVLHPQPATPLISQAGNQLISTLASSYQWFNNGLAIAGASGQSIVIPGAGLYSVTVTNLQGCKTGSAPFQAISMVTLPHFDYQLFPNPVVNHLQLSFFLKKAGTVNIDLLSIDGRRCLVLVNNQPLQPGAYQYRVPRVAQHLGKGVFLLRMQWNGETVVEKVMVQ